MPGTLYLVRHGRTVYNDAGLMQGWCDSPLTAEGLEGVRAMGQALAGRSFAAAYSSPSPRAVTTAEILLGHHPGLSLVVDDDLREFHFGDHEATPEADVFAEIDPWDLFGEVFAGRHPGLPGAAEDAASYQRRVGSAFARIEAAHAPDDDVLVVSHGVTLLTYLVSVADPPLLALDNAGLSLVRVDAVGGHDLLAVNLTASQAAGLPGAA